MTSVSADDYHYSGHPAAVDGFRKSFKFLREASCDILLTAHPDFSQLWARLERRQKGDANAMVDPKACRALADRSEEQLRQRLYSEQPHIYPTFPDKIDPLGRYVFYSHGLIVEGTDERPVHPENGVYDFPAIKQAIFKDGGFNLIAFHRPKNADAKAYAAMLEEWVRKLLKAGVPASRITIVGFSRGSGITAYAAARLRDTGIQTALMGACSNGDIPGGDALKLGGNLLNIYETTDTVLSCNVLAKRSDLKSFKEVAISTGKKHGAFFTPREEWIGPLKTWIRETNK
jgi:hypothetical protein